LLGASSSSVVNASLIKLVLINNCNYCVYRFGIISNKLDLNQETHFTILFKTMWMFSPNKELGCNDKLG
jgi:hypothetical protein